MEMSGMYIDSFQHLNHLYKRIWEVYPFIKPFLLKAYLNVCMLVDNIKDTPLKQILLLTMLIYLVIILY